MRTLFILLFSTLVQVICAQNIKGTVTDEESGDAIPHPALQYKGDTKAMAGEATGRFSIPRRNGEKLVISAVGYKDLQITVKPDTPDELNITLKQDTKQLKGVTVKAKRGKYSRKNNPAVELMKRVIAAKKRTDLSNHDYYQYNKYQKITLAVNDISPEEIEREQKKNRQWLLNQIEVCPYNNKLILPLSVDETVTQNLYRKSPEKEKTIILGQNSTGVNDLIQT